ncbi:unnamed protein product [Notodromas monacha]|uniref:GPR158/179 extracellular domain-containing protein n=1 Tax=Notodromas monacha TaxID=399045 RepID=A0A7R9GHQ5_9CRUS|nr:unnamed protein product [Notodromas monacha]CAG0921751.1 unnamed protein product [Notodromas monacha]
MDFDFEKEIEPDSTQPVEVSAPSEKGGEEATKGVEREADKSKMGLPVEFYFCLHVMGPLGFLATLFVFVATAFAQYHWQTRERYRKWLPDIIKNRQDTKTTYIVRIRHANNTNETITFHGPPGPDETPGPVKWVRPYFDCGRSNKWIFGASVPVADIYPRHTSFRHIEYPTFTAVSVMEMDFDRIDINQCPLGKGNPGPNVFAGTDFCKKETTECEPLHGYGFRRGGYQCRCNPGFRLPNVVRRPYLGQILERATAAEFERGFNCVPIGCESYLSLQI